MSIGFKGVRLCLLMGIAAISLAPPAICQAQAEQQFDFDLDAQDLDAALQKVGRQTGREIMYPVDVVTGKRSERLRGAFTADDAVRKLLAGSNLLAEFKPDVVLIRGREEPSGKVAASAAVGSEIVVIGSNIRGIVPAGSPTIGIDRTAIDRSGYATTQEILQSLPQAFAGGPNASTFGISQNNGSELGQFQGASINLRGLGASSTLTLVNSHRVPLGGYGQFADISLIPATAIERIEILTDGASAIYGSDAVAGVVNVKLRSDFEGGETRVRYGNANGDFSDIQVSQILGQRWATGHAVISYEYFRQGNLPASDRVYATEDLRAFGGGDYRGGYANPGTIIAGGRPFGIPSGQDGRNLTPGDLITGQVNKGDRRAGSDLLPQQRRHSAFATVEQDVSDNLRLRAEALYSRRAYVSHAQRDINSAVTVPVTNPFYVDPIGTGQPVRVQYDFTDDLGPYRRKGHSQSVYGSANADLTIGRWVASLSGTYGEQSDSDRTINIRNTFRLAQALADTNPDTAFNVFGDGAYNNPATVDRVRGSLTFAGRYRYSSAGIKADGPLFSLPGGSVKLSIGAEYRRESIASALSQDYATATPVVGPYFQVPGARKVGAAFGELYVPIVSETNKMDGINRLELSLALRTEHYNDFGSTTNPKAGIAWEPVGGLRFRGSYGRSFRAPAFTNLDQKTTRFYQPIALADPNSPKGFSNVLVILGNDPNIGPERATTWSVGADIKPAALPGTKLTVNYFNIAYRDRIVDPLGNLINFLPQRAIYQSLLDDSPSIARVQEIYAQPEFSNPDGLTPSDIEIIANAQVQNLSSVKVSGIDFDLSQTFSVAGGNAEIGIAGSYLFHIRQAVTDSAPSADLVSTLGFPIDLRMRGRAAWTNDRWSFALAGNFANHYANDFVATPSKVRSQLTLDAQIGYSFPRDRGVMSGLRVLASGTNILDRSPPYAEFVTGISAIGYDPENASPVGRTLSLQIIKQW
jgi:iron complex outermembrane receptor protein